jgi:hypothetical protein
VGKIDWHPRELVLRGKFCEEHEVKYATDLLRQLLGSELVVVIPYDEINFLPILSFVSAESEATEAAILNQLRSGRHDKNLRSACLGGDPEDLIEKLKGMGVLQQEWSYTAKDTPHELISSRALSAWVIARNPAELRSEYSLDIATYINGTEVANLRRDKNLNVRMRTGISDVAKRSKKRKGEAVPLFSSIDTLVEVSAGIFDAREAVLYTVRNDARALELTSKWNSDEDETGRFPSSVDIHADHISDPIEGESLEETVRQVYQQSAVHIFPSPYDNRSNRNENLVPSPRKEFIQDQYGVVAIPIPYLSVDSPEASNVGVLALLRSHNSLSQFDMGALRNLALRISATVRDARQRDSNLEIRNYAKELASVDEQLKNDSARTIARSHRRATGFPSDITRAEVLLQKLVNHLYHSTLSSSVTLRIVAPSPRSTDAEVERVLHSTRFIAAPAETMRDASEQIPIYGLIDGKPASDISYNAAVAISGKKRLWRIGERSSPILSQERRSRSELCVPVYSNGHIVGTLNLESALKGAYDMTSEVAEVFAALAGLAIMKGRQETLAEVARRAAAERIGPHEVDNARKSISEIEGYLSNGGGAPTGIDVKLRELSQLVSRFDTESFDSPDEDFSETSLVGLVQVALRRTQKIMTIDTSFRHDYLPPVRDRKTIAVVLEELVSNLLKHRSADMRPSVGTYATRLGGKSYSVLCIRNTVAELQSPAFVESVYREPITKFSDEIQRPHLGCYMVGEFVRSIGGDVYLSCSAYMQSRPAYVMQTTVFLPDENDAQSQDGHDR